MRKERSSDHASASGVDFQDVEHIKLVEPDDHVSRHARLHREAGRSGRAAHLELERREVLGENPKMPARVPRDTEPCRLWVFLTLVLFLVLCVAALGAGAMHAARVSVTAAMAYADAAFPALIRWIGDVLRWVAS